MREDSMLHWQSGQILLGCPELHTGSFILYCMQAEKKTLFSEVFSEY